MPLIAFKPADVLANKVLAPGWYGAQIVKVGDWKASTAGDSYNMEITFSIEGSEGKEVDRLYNSKPKAIRMLLPLAEAALGIVFKPEEFNVNTDDLLNKKLDVKLGVKIYEGRTSNEIQEYLPYGRSKDAPAF